MDSSERFLYGYIKKFKFPPDGNYGFVNENGQTVDYMFHINQCTREDGKPVTEDDLQLGQPVKFLPLGDETKAKKVIILS